MDQQTQLAGDRLAAILQVLLMLVSTEGEDDGRELNSVTRHGYLEVLALAKDAGLVSDTERAILEGVTARWGYHPAVVRELLACFISEVLSAARGPGLAAVVASTKPSARSRP